MSRRVTALLIAACLVVGVLGLFGRDLLRDLVSGGMGEESTEQARPLSAAEAQRLASMRQRNWEAGQSGVRATIGDRDDAVYAVGWLDWHRELAYLALSRERQPGVVTELVQAVPDLIATRPMPGAGDGPPTPMPEPTAGPATGAATPAAGTVTGPLPPLKPPADGWEVRRPGSEPLDTLLTLLFTVATDEPDAADLLARSEAQWLRQDHTAGHDVDVLLGPAVPPTDPPATGPAPEDPPATSDPAADGTPAADPPGSPAAGGYEPGRSLAAMGGAVQYWLDRDARLHRMDALLAADIPVQVDLDRSDRTVPVPLDLLGGPAVDPRPVTGEEATALSELRERSVTAAGGGEVILTLPGEEETTQAAGWLDWERTGVYLAVSGGDLRMEPAADPEQPTPDDAAPDTDEPADALLIADYQGVAVLPGHSPTGTGGMPPVPVPRSDDWRWAPWETRGDEHGGFDLDLLLNEALALGGEIVDDPERLRETAIWLREDELDGTPVTGYEIPREIEQEVAPGEARMRYWVDDAGVLRRLEIRTRSGGFGQLDLTPAPVPAFLDG